MKKFVVTGGSGFIGSNLVKFLLNKNYFVINIDKLSYSANPYNLKEISKNKNYRFFKQDINFVNFIIKLILNIRAQQIKPTCYSLILVYSHDASVPRHKT